MSGAKEQLLETSPSLAVYFAVGFGAALLVVGAAWLLSAFSLWRLKVGGGSDPAAAVRLAGAAALGEFVALAQAANLVFIGVRRNDYEQLGVFFSQMVPSGTGSVVTVTFALLTFSLFISLRREIRQTIAAAGAAIAGRS
jgi:hypothetical protein